MLKFVFVCVFCVCFCFFRSTLYVFSTATSVISSRILKDHIAPFRGKQLIMPKKSTRIC